MGVLKVNVGTDVAPDWRKIGCGTPPVTGASYTDDFNRADNSSTVGAGWATCWDPRPAYLSAYSTAVWGVYSNRAYMARGLITTGGGAVPALLYPTATDGVSPDVDMQVTNAETGTNGNGAGRILGWRYDPADGSHFGVGGGGVYYLDSASATTTFAALTYVQGDVVRAEVVGNVHSVYINGTQVATFTSASNATLMRHGILNDIQAAGGPADVNPISYARKYDDFSITVGTPTTGRLKLNVGTPEAPVWVREKCDDDTGVARPLKMWDGTTWQTVACMVFSAEDASAAGVYDTAPFDYSVYG